MWLLLSCFLCILFLAAIYFFRVRSVVKFRNKADAERPDIADSDYLPASVVVYSQGNADMLGELLEVSSIAELSAAYEVIVVNDGESADVRDTVSMLRATHPNLYLTFTPGRSCKSEPQKTCPHLGSQGSAIRCSGTYHSCG